MKIIKLFSNFWKLFRKKKIDVDSLKEDHKELILKTKKRRKSECHNVFAGEINNIALSSNGDKRMESVFSIETYAYGGSKDLVSKKYEVKCNTMIKHYKNNYWKSILFYYENSKQMRSSTNRI